jgi:hypothetical protein
MAIVQEIASAGHIPGMSIAIAKPDKVLYTAAVAILVMENHRY